MTSTAATVVVVLALSFSVALVPVRANAQSGDPCEKKTSNMEMRECYARESARANAETDTLAKRIADEFGREAQNPVNAPVVADLLRKAASSVMQSQKTWKDYRDQHCSAVEYSWTTGSGAGTAYEACLFELGQARLRELRSAFEEAASH